MFRGRNLIIATKHKKEKVIAPWVEMSLGVNCIASKTLDTDSFGTFTGEVDRKDDPLATARKKCMLAMELHDCDLAIASEGSFGPHPSLFFVPADDEILLFIDKKNEIEIVERELTSDTNFSGEEISNTRQLEDFAIHSKFPDHGLILRKSKEDGTEIIKGITDWNQLTASFHSLKKKYGTTYIETDMRAMFNPTRMRVIERVAQKLVNKINSLCPRCNFPGYGVTDVKHGLPCSLCSFPTRSALSHLYTCQKCLFTDEVKYPNNTVTENPMYCDNCNP